MRERELFEALAIRMGMSVTDDTGPMVELQAPDGRKVMLYKSDMLTAAAESGVLALEAEAPTIEAE